MEIQNKLAVVTGGSRGIGLATVKALIQQGAVVASWSRTPPKSFSHPNFHHFETDLTKEESVERSYAATTKSLGKQVGVLINNAGVGYRGVLEEMETERWRYLFDLNVHAIFYTTKRVIPAMKKAGAGHIINIGSGAATNGIAQMSCYCGTKHAVAGISESLHLELRDYGIKVSCVSPGSVDTGFSSSKKNKLKPENLAQTIIHILQAASNYHIPDIQIRPLQPILPPEESDS